MTETILLSVHGCNDAEGRPEKVQVPLTERLAVAVAELLDQARAAGAPVKRIFDGVEWSGWNPSSETREFAARVTATRLVVTPDAFSFQAESPSGTLTTDTVSLDVLSGAGLDASRLGAERTRSIGNARYSRQSLLNIRNALHSVSSDIFYDADPFDAEDLGRYRDIDRLVAGAGEAIALIDALIAVHFPEPVENGKKTTTEEQE